MVSSVVNNGRVESLLLPLLIHIKHSARIVDLLSCEKIISVKANGPAIGEFFLKSYILKVAVLFVESRQHLVASNVQAYLLLTRGDSLRA